jgi:hypothetical protein
MKLMFHCFEFGLQRCATADALPFLGPETPLPFLGFNLPAFVFPFHGPIAFRALSVM